MTIIPAFRNEQRSVNRDNTYLCPICNIEYGHIRDPENLLMDVETPCTACGFFGRVSEFIPEINATQLVEEQLRQLPESRYLEVKEALRSDNVTQELERIDFHLDNVTVFLVKSEEVKA